MKTQALIETDEKQMYVELSYRWDHAECPCPYGDLIVGRPDSVIEDLRVVQVLSVIEKHPSKPANCWADVTPTEPDDVVNMIGIAQAWLEIKNEDVIEQIDKEPAPASVSR